MSANQPFIHQAMGENLPKHILVVDDNALSHELLNIAFAQTNYHTTMVTSGEEAFAFLEEHWVDAILLDLIMPEMDGFSVLSHLKAHKQWQSIPVIVISGIEDITSVVKCMQMGAVDYLNKPINPTILQKRLGMALSTQLLEETYHVLVEHTMHGLAIDQDGVLVFVNPAFTKITGYTKDELVGMTTQEFSQKIVYPDDRPLSWQRYQNRLAGHVVPKYESRCVRPDGSVRWVEVHGTMIYYQNRQAHQLMLLDITERKQAEKAYQVLVENSVQGLALFQDDKIIFVNTAFARITGYSVPEILTMSAPESHHTFLYPEDRHLSWQRYEQRLAGAKIPKQEVRIVRPNGSLRWAEIDSVNIDYQNKPAIQIMLLDITERKKAEEAYHILVESSVQGLAIMQDKLVFVNRALAQMTGYTKAALSAMSPQEFNRIIIHPDDQDNALQNYQDRLVGNLVPNYELRIIRLNGDVRWWEVNAMIIDYQNRPATQFMTLDITERKLAEIAILNQQHELQQRNEELDAFAGMVAHDLKNSLTGILNISELLLQSRVPLTEENRQHWLGRIAQTSTHMKHVVQELLLLARIRKEDIQTEPLLMSSILNNVQHRLYVMFEKYHPQLILPNAYPTVYGHSTWIEEVWFNYISNAIKYGGNPPYIEIGATPQGEMVFFWVKDNGNGIDPANQTNLFVPFQRFDTHRARGHGLGLSIVQRIVDKLGGQVGVESEVGKGSKFWFTLPICQKDE